MNEEQLPSWLEEAMKRMASEASSDPEQFDKHVALTRAGLEQAWALVQDKLPLFSDLVARNEPQTLPRTEEGEVRIDSEDYKVLHELARMVVQEGGLRILGKDEPEPG